MTVIVGLTDRAGCDANTDNLVLVDGVRRRLLWIPRDLWCPTLGDRVNAAFRRGGLAGLIAALREHDLDAEDALVVSRDAVERAVADLAVLVPIPVRMEFAYPLTPTSRIEDGRKRIVFEPPAEVLRGERIHQWIGARSGSDLHRIERQKIFVRRLIEQGAAFGRVLYDQAAWRASGPAAIDVLARVRSTWRFDTLGPLEPALVDRKDVLLRRPERARSGR